MIPKASLAQGTIRLAMEFPREGPFDSLRSLRAAQGIEPYAALFEKWRRRATFVVKSRQGNEFQADSLPCSFPRSPLESS